MMLAGSRKGFCCFLFQIANRRRTAAGTRRIQVTSDPLTDYPAVVRGSCRLPRFMATPGPVKSVVKNSPGNRHKTPD
jgi:hypothetical protein